MTKANAVKRIFNEMKNRNMDGGIPKAVEIYNYIGCYGELEVTVEDIVRYFK